MDSKRLARLSMVIAFIAAGVVVFLREQAAFSREEVERAQHDLELASQDYIEPDYVLEHGLSNRAAVARTCWEAHYGFGRAPEEARIPIDARFLLPANAPEDDKQRISLRERTPRQTEFLARCASRLSYWHDQGIQSWDTRTGPAYWRYTGGGYNSHGLDFIYKVAGGFALSAWAVEDEEERVRLLIDGIEELVLTSEEAPTYRAASSALEGVYQLAISLQMNFLHTTTLDAATLHEMRERIEDLEDPTGANRVYLRSLAVPARGTHPPYNSSVPEYDASWIGNHLAFSEALERCEADRACWRFERVVPPAAPRWLTALRGPYENREHTSSAAAAAHERFAAQNAERYRWSQRTIGLSAHLLQLAEERAAGSCPEPFERDDLSLRVLTDDLYELHIEPGDDWSIFYGRPMPAHHLLFVCATTDEGDDT